MVSMLARYRLPVMHPYPYLSAGLMCYGVPTYGIAFCAANARRTCRFNCPTG